MVAHIVFIALVLGETKDKQAALNEASRVLIPGGLLAVAESMIDPHYCTKSEVKKLATRAGLEEWNVTGGFAAYTALYRKPGQYNWRRY
jgi:ubiquinone/menaquinone biosynthesis C-methylase UbiE